MKKKLKKVLSLILLALLIFQQSNAVAFADEVSDSGKSQPQIVIEESELEMPEESEEPVATEESTETEVPTETPTETVVPTETETPTEQSENQDFTFEESGVQVELHLSSAVADDVTLSVEKIDADSFDNEAFETWTADKTVIGASIYDIHLIDVNGDEIETGEATIKVKLDEIAVPEVEESETTLTFLHVTDDGNIEEGTVDDEGTSAEITASGLSPFIFVRTSSEKDGIRIVDGTTIIDVGSADDFTTALETINNGEGNFTINITADITMASSINIKKNTVTIGGNNHTLDFGSLEQAIVVNGSSSASPTLILGKDANSTLTLKSNGQVRPDGSHFIIVGDSGALNGSGTLQMNTGVTVKDAYTNNTFGGGVLVGNGGKFVMNGGTITNCGIIGGSVCHGGGVAVICGGEFVMNGGNLSYCSANSEGYTYGWSYAWATGGGVYVGLGSTFTMNGGTIDHNSASSNGGGVMVIESQDNYYDKGLGYLDSRFEMNGGTIQYNKTGYIGGGLAVMGTTSFADGLCTATPSSGAPSNPGVYISGGSFIGNTASYGGGIVFYQIRGSIPMQIHKATITGNDAGYGGGVCAFGYWTNTDIDECTITDNTAGQGGGICMLTNSSGGNTTLKNSTITGNAADTKIGGGVYYDSNSNLTISGQNTIQNNTYNGVINNLNILDDSHPVYVNGSLSGSSIGLSDPTLWNDNLADSDSTAVSTAKLTSGFKENNDGINPEDVFTSDHNTWVPDYGEKKEDTTSLGYDSTASTWSDVTVMDTVWVAADNQTYGSTSKGTLAQVYYNTKNKEYSTTSSGNYAIAMIEKDGTYYLAYKNSNKYYILKLLLGTPELNTFVLGGREMTYAHFLSDLSLDGFNYIRTNDFTNSSTKSVSCYELTEVSNGDGYDYSNEVRLVRGYTIKYKDNDSDAYFGTIVYPTTYNNKEVVLVDPAEKTGYEFKGWYRDQVFTDGPITKLSDNEIIDDNGNIVLYAKWAKKINSDDIVVGDLENVVYNGKDQKLVPTVKTSDGTDLLSSDYTIGYTSDTKNVGEVTVAIKGIGNYTGTVTKTYEITKKELTVKTESGEKVYDGKPLTAKGSIEGFVEGESAELKVTGSQTDVGTSDNKYTIVWNDTTKESNYEVKETVGTLTVKAQSTNNGQNSQNNNDNQNTSNNGNLSTPQTGDNSNIGLWFAILLLSYGAVTAITVALKKKKSNR